MSGRAAGLPIRLKPVLMDALPWWAWKRLAYPLWLRWYKRWLANDRIWKSELYKPGDRVRWRGVHLICCTQHFAGGAADHPWEPGWGWAEWKAAVLWEPTRPVDRLLLRLIGDPRRRTPTSAEERVP